MGKKKFNVNIQHAFTLLYYILSQKPEEIPYSPYATETGVRVDTAPIPKESLEPCLDFLESIRIDTKVTGILEGEKIDLLSDGTLNMNRITVTENDERKVYVNLWQNADTLVAFEALEMAVRMRKGR